MASAAFVTVSSISTNSVWYKVQVKGTNVSKNMEFTPTFASNEATIQSDLLAAVISFCSSSLGITVTADDIVFVGAPAKLAAV
jgi:5-keto 4-deoxyuronate isomerase